MLPICQQKVDEFRQAAWLGLAAVALSTAVGGVGGAAIIQIQNPYSTPTYHAPLIGGGAGLLVGSAIAAAVISKFKV